MEMDANVSEALRKYRAKCCAGNPLLTSDLLLIRKYKGKIPISVNLQENSVEFLKF